MKLIAFSDPHLDADTARAVLEAAELADLVICAGDFAQRHEGLEGYMALFAPIAERLICVPGNNESLDALRRATTATVLHGGTVTREGLTFAGLGGGIPPLPIMPWVSWDLSEETAAQMLAAIESCDVLVTHSPPYGAADRHAELGAMGSTAIRAAVERLQPRLHLCGHVHDDWGTRARIGATEVVNLGPAPVGFEL